MYTFLKRIIRTLLPISIVYKYEYVFRYFIYLFYIGNKFECNICNTKIRKFKIHGQDKICPSCGSLSRNRRLWQILKRDYLKKGIHILDFSPSRNLYRLLKKEQANYTSSDLSNNFLSDVKYDITKIPLKDGYYNLIICYHILEHVIDDKLAMSELFRVLKKKGTCIIQTPFKEEEIYEDYLMTTESQRKLHFGQEDHVRIYSAEGLKTRLIQVGFNVRIKTFSATHKNTNGFNQTETILICSK